MIGSEIFKDMKEFGQSLIDDRGKEANIAWIMENRDDLVANYPNRWVAVDHEVVQIVNPDFFEVVKVIEGRQAMSDSIVFYFSNLYATPLIVKFCDVKSPEAIS